LYSTSIPGGISRRASIGNILAIKIFFDIHNLVIFHLIACAASIY
jgi:hypothetical protein